MQDGWGRLGTASKDKHQLEAAFSRGAHPPARQLHVLLTSGSFFCSIETPWMSPLHSFQRRSLLVLFPDMNQNLLDNPPCFYHLYIAKNDLLSINRLRNWAVPFANIKVEIALTEINNACPFPHAALLIFSPSTEPSVCRKNSISPLGIPPTKDQGRKILIYYIPIILFL